MDELIKQLLALPILDKTRTPWQLITAIYPTLKEKTLLAFIDALTPHQAVIKPADMAIVTNYMQFFFKITADILAINMNIAKIWEKIAGAKITNDELLPITIELLPHNVDKLTTLLTRIDDISQISSTGAAAFALTNLYTASTVKILHLEKGDAASHSNENELKKIKEVVKEVTRKSVLTKLKQATLAYKQKLADAIEQYIKDNDAAGHALFYKNHPDRAKELIPYDIIENKEYSDKAIVNKPTLKLLLSKYLIVGDLLISLTRKNYSREFKLIEFSEKFDYHKKLLSESHENLGHYLLLTAGGLFGIDKNAYLTTEEKFLLTAAHYMTIIKGEAQKYEVIAPGLYAT